MKRKIKISYECLGELSWLLSEGIETLNIAHIQANGDLFTNLLLERAISLDLQMSKELQKLKYLADNTATLSITRADELAISRILVSCKISGQLQRFFNLQLINISKENLNLQLLLN